MIEHDITLQLDIRKIALRIIAIDPGPNSEFYITFPNSPNTNVNYRIENAKAFFLSHV